MPQEETLGFTGKFYCILDENDSSNKKVKLENESTASKVVNEATSKRKRGRKGKTVPDMDQDSSLETTAVEEKVEGKGL